MASQTHRTKHIYVFTVFRFNLTKMRQSAVILVSHWSIVAVHTPFNAFIYYSVVFFILRFLLFASSKMKERKKKKNNNNNSQVSACTLNEFVVSLCFSLFTIINILLYIGSSESVCGTLAITILRFWLLLIFYFGNFESFYRL